MRNPIIYGFDDQGGRHTYLSLSDVEKAQDKDRLVKIIYFDEKLSRHVTLHRKVNEPGEKESEREV